MSGERCVDWTSFPFPFLHFSFPIPLKVATVPFQNLVTFTFAFAFGRKPPPDHPLAFTVPFYRATSDRPIARMRSLSFSFHSPFPLRPFRPVLPNSVFFHFSINHLLFSDPPMFSFLRRVHTTNTTWHSLSFPSPLPFRFLSLSSILWTQYFHSRRPRPRLSTSIFTRRRPNPPKPNRTHPHRTHA
jgi:hypothetical protein